MRPNEQSQLLSLIELIYQGATDISRWPAIVEGISQWMGASTCGLLTPWHTPDNGGLLITHGLSQQSNELWATKYCLHDIWAQQAIEKNVLTTGNVVRDQELVPEQEFLDSIWYKEFLSKLGLGRLISGIIFSPQDADTLPVVCSCMRPFEHPFSADDAQKMRVLLPHLSRSVGVMFRLREAEFTQASTLSALDRITQGVLLFDRNGCLTFLNATAKRLIKLKDGLSLRSRNGNGNGNPSELVASTEKISGQLAEAIKEAISPDILSTRHFSSAVVIPRPSGNSPFVINFSSLSNTNVLGLANSHPRAIAFIHNCAAAVRLNGSLLKDAYGLTEAEIRTAELLVNGCSIEEAAQELEVSVNTVKTQLRQLHDKTRINNRAKLVKLLLSMTSP